MNTTNLKTPTFSERIELAQVSYGEFSEKLHASVQSVRSPRIQANLKTFASMAAHVFGRAWEDTKSDCRQLFAEETLSENHVSHEHQASPRLRTP